MAGDKPYFFTFINKVINCFFYGICYRTHCHNNIFSIFSTVIGKGMVLPAGNLCDFLHVLFNYIRYSIIIGVNYLPGLKIYIRILRRSPCNRMFGIQGVVTKFLHLIIVYQLRKLIRLDCLDLLYLVRSTKTIKKMEKWNFTLNC